MEVWRVTRSTWLQSLAVRSVFVLNSTPSGNKFMSIIDRMGMQIASKFQGPTNTQNDGVKNCYFSINKFAEACVETQLHLHAAKTFLTQIDNTKHAILFSNLSNGGSGEGVAEQAACKRVRRTPGRMADNLVVNPPDPH
eukprot:581970-Pelagomonas_calceolata.AAC.1